MLHVNRAWEPHVNLIPSHFTHSFSKKIIKIPLENPCMWVTILSTIKSVTNAFISWGGKTEEAKKKEPVGSLFLLNNCCEQAAAGMLRAFPVYFVPLKSNSTQPNVHDSCADTEDCIKCGFSHETDCWRNYCEDSFWMNLDILYRCRSLATNRMLHINCAQEPHIN